MAQIKLMSVTIEGEKIGFTSMTGFVVQSTGTPNGKYKTVTSGKGNDFPTLLAAYKAIKVVDGTRKRICMNGEVLVRGR